MLGALRYNGRMAVLEPQTISIAIGEVADRYSVREAYLFGSHARREADDASDVDLCIECGEGFTLFSLGGLGKALEDALGRSVDIVCGEDSFYPKARQRYLKDRVLVYARS